MQGTQICVPYRMGIQNRIPTKASRPRGVIYEHIHVSPGRLEVSGEHIMSEAGPLHFHQDFFGADEAISNYEPGRPDWVATLILVDETREKAWAKTEPRYRSDQAGMLDSHTVS